jgi:hypothetical protein
MPRSPARSGGQRRTKAGQWLRSTTRLAIYLRDDWTCVWCGARSGPYGEGVTLTVDHYIPDTLGGTNTPTNLLTACWACNCTRREASVEEFRGWLEWRGVDVALTDWRMARRHIDLGAFRPWALALHKAPPPWLVAYRKHAARNGRETYASRFGTEGLAFQAPEVVLDPHRADSGADFDYGDPGTGF